MKKWEDIVKDKLEAPEGALPESVFAEFRSRREAAAAAPRRFPWVWVAVPAVAAGLAAVLLLRQPSMPTDGVQFVPQPPAPVALVTEEEEPEQVSQIEEIAVAAQTHAMAPAREEKMAKEVETSREEAPAKEVEPVKEVEPAKEEEPAKEVEPTKEEVVDQVPAQPALWPSVPEQPVAGRKRMKVGAASGIIGGGGLLAAAGGLAIVKGNTSGGGRPTFMGPNDDKLVGQPVHYFPVRVGLSVGIPVARRWFLSTGLDYSLYLSTFNYKIAGTKRQAAHYLGIPVRMNWVFASNSFMDVYVGAGVVGDVCLNAGGFSLSLQGVGGIQFNLTRWMGIYIEPELSWRIPMGTPKLETYRSQHPLMFSVAAGLRFQIGNNKK